MKQKKIKKNVIALLLAVAMIVTSFPVFSHDVHAAGNQLPTKEQFATVDELKSFNTNDNDGEKNPAKVYFGNNNQQWWIAGSQNGNVTLFAASPLARGVQFNENRDEREYKGQSVYSNHYGASDIKKTVKEMETSTSYFTGAEQGLMNDTTIYTNDTKNNSVYSTKDKLYLAYGDYKDHHITVGINSENSLNDGLRIDMDYWKNDVSFWLRAPHMNFDYDALVANSGGYVEYKIVYDYKVLVPAFELNLSSVIFASAAPAATSNGSLALSDAFTLRYKSETDIGTATIGQSKGSIGVTDVRNENTYLVVQNSQGAWSKKVSSNDLVFASDIDSSLTSFENCKVWLETTSDRITYAKEAIQGSGHNVKVNIGENLTVNGGNILQTNVSGDITEITIKVNEGYYLPDNYTNTIQGLNGLTVKDVTQYGFTISGTPTSDINITLPEATVLLKADTPVVELKTTATSITATVTNYKTEFGDIEYKWDGGNWEKDKNTLSNLQAETTYQLVVRFTGNGFYQMSDEYSINITTLKDGNNVVVSPNEIKTTYSRELKLSDLALPQGWSWENEDTSLSAGTNLYPALFDTTNLENTTDFSGVEGYDASTHKVTRNVNVIVNKADSEVTITTSSLDKVYDGNEISAPEYTTTGSNGQVTIKWQEKSNTSKSEWKDLDKAPSNAGSYRVVVELAGNDNYNSTSASLEFEIRKAIPLYAEVTGLVLGQGQALSTIVLPENFKWVDDTIVGDKLGTHRFEAIYTPEDTANYLTVNVEIEVEVVPVPEKINHVPTIKADDQTITIGDKFDALKGVSATDYEDGELKVEVIKNTVNTSKVGEYEVTYKVVDSKGATVTKTIKVKVLEAIEDKEVLEDKIEEIVNKDDYTQESYEEYLEALEKAKDVLNNPNASKEEIQEALENLEAAMNKLQKVENTVTPETSDQTNIYLYTSMITLASVAIVYLSLKKKKTNLSK